MLRTKWSQALVCSLAAKANQITFVLLRAVVLDSGSNLHGTFLNYSGEELPW